MEKAKTPTSGSIATSTSTSQTRGAAQNEVVGTAVTYGEPAPVPVIPFLEQQYLAFRLGNPWLEESSDSDNYTQYDSDSDSDAETTSSDNDADSESGDEEPDSTRPKIFLESEWERFMGQRQGRNGEGVATDNLG